MHDMEWLQLFAEGGEGSAAGDGAADTGVAPADPGRERLMELGVPEAKIRKRASKAVSDQMTAESDAAAQQSAPAEEAPRQEEASITRLTWQQIREDPEYRKEMDREKREAVQARFKNDPMQKMQGAMEVLARRYKMDTTNGMDYDALNKAIEDDLSNYDDMATEMDTSPETARMIDKQQRELKRQQAAKEQARQAQEQAALFASWDQQEAELKKIYPNFDLRAELQNERFARAISPSGGMTVEQAFHAFHHNELEAIRMQTAAQQMGKQFSNAVQAGSRRPQELGTTGKASSVTSIDWRKASKEQREEMKARIRRGEKVYPGR